MPEQNDVQNAMQGMDSKPWLDRDEWYVCCVDLGGEDHAELLAVSGRITDHLEDIVALLRDTWPQDAESAASMDVLQEALSGDLPDRIWDKLDQLLTEHIKDWNLKTYAEKHGLDRPPRPPEEYEDPQERQDMLKSLPTPLLARLIYGLAWHSGNF